MSTVTLSSVFFAYSDSVALISDASVQLGAGWTGVVGANGAGKTTLLQLIVGELAQLELHAPELGRWESLSPGERKRWQIGAVLAAEPGLLLLDEPTNHLDVAARELLLEALRRYRGIGVVVSHDRELLNDLTSNTLRIQSGKVRSYHGSYETARTTWEREAREQRQADERLRSEKKKLRKRLGERRGQRASAQSRMRTSKRMKSAKDSDARRRFKAKRRRSAEVGLGREIGRLNASLERIERQRGGFEFENARSAARSSSITCLLGYRSCSVCTPRRSGREASSCSRTWCWTCAATVEFASRGRTAPARRPCCASCSKARESPETDCSTCRRSFRQRRS